MYVRHGLKDPLFVIAAFYFYFAFGPIINFLVGGQIYFGILQHRIPEASLIFLLGLSAFFLISVVIKPKHKQAVEILEHSSSRFFALNFVLLILIAYQLYALVVALPSVWGLPKNSQINYIGPSLHYNLLLLQFYVLSFYFFRKNSSGTRALYTINFALYLIYCIAFQERDFIFLLMSVLLHRQLLVRSDQTPRILNNVRFGLIAVTLTALATYIFVLRFDTAQVGFGLESMLNQGTLLFINTQVFDLIRTFDSFYNGQTYINSLFNLLPNQIYNTDFNLLNWFKEFYAPGGVSGYGFALDAEAYMNFGYAGVFFFFSILAMVQRFIFNRISISPFYLYFSVFFTGFLAYSLRNDSLALIKGSVYAILFYMIVVIASGPAARAYKLQSYWRQQGIAP
jgi:hypothetical protein